MTAWRFPGTLLIALATLSTYAQDKASHEQTSRIRQIVLSRGEDSAAVAHLVQLTRDLSPADAAVLFGQLASDYLTAGKHDQAAEVLSQLIDQYQGLPAADEAALTLVRLYTSSEVLHTQAKKPISSAEELATYALHLAGQARSRRPALANDPAHAFQSAVAARLSNRLPFAQSFLSPLKHNPRMRPWHERAQAEQWLTTSRQEEGPLAVRRAARIGSRPHLDGQLQESFWQNRLAASQSKATHAWFARDDEFLYLAVQCEKRPEIRYAADDRPRSYDADLSDHDYVRLRFDLDRDYATCFELSVDHRGWTADRCWLAQDWNPRWFVAAAQNATHWTLEGAIPWSELGGPPPSPAAWALAVERQIPGFDAVPAEFELLLFEDAKRPLK